jgi:hypothetical protein
MRSRTSVLAAIVIAFLFAGSAVADEQLITALKTLGKAVDDMSANMSKAESDADAELMADATRQTLAQGLKYDGLKVEVKATAGFCRVTLETPAWILWSEAKAGKIVDHGATIR